MSHAVPFHLRSLHSSSKAEVDSLMPPTTWYTYGTRKSVQSLYPQTASIPALEPQIPDPELFASLTPASTGPSSSSLEVTASEQQQQQQQQQQQPVDLPTVAECAVHLELLEVFCKLRLDIIKSAELDAAFGVVINNKTVYRREYNYRKRGYVSKPVKLKDETWQARRRKKWSYFLGLAVGRFKVWVAKMNSFLKAANKNKPAMGWSELPFLPPLDVLMVWHAFLLNPKDYANPPRGYDLSEIRRLPFPWKVVHDAINRRDWTFALPEQSAEWNKTDAGLEPHLFRYLCDAGKRKNEDDRVATTLARYGQDHVHILTAGQLLDMQAAEGSGSGGSGGGLSSRDAAFLTVLRSTEASKDRDRALADNVRRQASFVDKMHAQLWIRSPAVSGTLRRAVDRYAKFLRLFRLNSGKVTLVPTLDVDIVWHTHQCSARMYAESVKDRTGFFLNHDDKLGRPVLDGGMEETKKLFFVRFGEEYERCLCWDCEATASAVEEADAKEEAEEEGKEEEEGEGGMGEADVAALVEKVRKDVEYYRCVEISRRKGEKLPVR